MIEKESLSDSVVRAILKSLKRGDYQPGDRLPTIQELSKILNVGLSSVREGLQQLQCIGIIEIQQGKGTYVKQKVDVDMISKNIENLLILQKPYISHLLSARRVIELETVRLSAVQANNGQIQELYSKLQRMKNSLTALDIFAVEDVDFHIFIAECTGNPIFGIFLKSIQGLLTEEVRAVLRLSGAAERAINYHGQIYQAILNHDPEQAVKRMDEHITDIEKAIKKAENKSHPR